MVGGFQMLTNSSNVVGILPKVPPVRNISNTRYSLCRWCS